MDFGKGYRYEGIPAFPYVSIRGWIWKQENEAGYVQPPLEMVNNTPRTEIQKRPWVRGNWERGKMWSY